MSFADELKELLPETEGFPTGDGVKLIRGKTLTKTPQWLKAILLVDTGGKEQIRLYGWQLIKGEYKVRQKFNISHGYSAEVAEILMAFYTANA
ncbi:MAG: hypothetical protein ACXAE3_00535 [Candidatus Kariarchaeaceae archaeon]|jgi:hypothetical protein